MSPEVLNHSYTMNCDLWSLGVIAYSVLTGVFPFTGDTIEELLMLY